MGSYTSNSYGPIIYTNPGENKDKKHHGRSKRLKPSSYKRLNKDYPIEKHVRVTTAETVVDIRQSMSLRIKDKFLNEMSADLENGFVGKIGADVYVIKNQLNAYEVYLREGTRRKAYKKKLQLLRTSNT